MTYPPVDGREPRRPPGATDGAEAPRRAVPLGGAGSPEDAVTSARHGRPGMGLSGLMSGETWRSVRWFILAAGIGILLLVAGQLLGPGGPGRGAGGGSGRGIIPLAGPGGRAGTGDSPGAGAPAGGASPGLGAGQAVDGSIEGAEARLAALLSEHLTRVAGAGTVNVLVSLASGHEHRFGSEGDRMRRRTEETDPQGGRRTVTESTESVRVLWQPGAGTQREPAVEKVMNVEVRGVLVIAAGAADPAVRARLHGAVQTLLDLPAHRIKVVPGGG